MPTITSFNISTSCSTAPNTPTRIYVQSFYDAPGTGTLTWTKNGGEVPSDLEAYLKVYQNGKRLDYLDEYEVTPGSGSATIQIYAITPPFPGAYYTVEATFV